MPLDFDRPSDEPRVGKGEVAHGPLFPEVHVKLVGEDGNAGAIMNRVVQELKEASRANLIDLSREDIDRFRAECMSGNYQELLQTVQSWVEVY